MIKDMLKEWRMLIIIVICIGLVLFAINLNNKNTDNDIVNNGDKATDTVIARDNILNVTGDDKNFTIWLTMSSSLITSDLDCITKAAKKRNFTDTERCGKSLKENSNRALINTKSHGNISSRFVPILVQYKNALKNYSIGGENLEIGAKNKNTTQMVIANDYISIANKDIIGAGHLYRSIKLNNSITDKNSSIGTIDKNSSV